MDGEGEFEVPVIRYQDERDYMRLQADSYRGAALIGYGALLAANTDGRYKLVLEAMDHVLFPKQ